MTSIRPGVVILRIGRNGEVVQASRREVIQQGLAIPGYHERQVTVPHQASPSDAAWRRTGAGIRKAMRAVQG